MLMASGSYVEKRGLSTVRIAYESDPDLLAALLRKGIHFLFQPVPISFKGTQSLGSHLPAHLLHCLSLADDLDLCRLFATKRNLITYYFIFDRVSQRGVKDHLHLIALHKAHLDYPLAETAVTGYSHDHATLASLQF